MKVDDPAVLDALRRSMTARIATISHNGRPSINPLYFVYVPSSIWLGTVEWTRASHNVQADPRVSVLFEVEQDRGTHRVLRIIGRASVRTDPQLQSAYNHRVARKYILTPGGIRHYLAHLRQFPLMRRYHGQSASRGQSCVIDVTPLEAEFLGEEKPD